MAGQQEFRHRNTFGATASSSYGAFWAALATFIVLDLAHALLSTLNVNNALGWFFASFAIFNMYMLLCSTRLTKAVFAVFLTLEVTEMLVFIGYFLVGAGHASGTDVLHAAGYVGVVTAACAWYASAAGVINSMSDHPVLKVGSPIWAGHGGAVQPAARLGGGYGQAIPQH